MPQNIKNDEIKDVSGGAGEEVRYSFTAGESFRLSPIMRVVVSESRRNIGLNDWVFVKKYITNPATKHESFFEDSVEYVYRLIEADKD